MSDTCGVCGRAVTVCIAHPAWHYRKVACYRIGLEKMTKERDAYKKAKDENDDRFMRERDEAREALVALTTDCRRLMTVLFEIASPDYGSSEEHIREKARAAAGGGWQPSIWDALGWWCATCNQPLKHAGDKEHVCPKENP